MSASFPSFILGLFLVIVFGCYRTYTGIYFMGDGPHAIHGDLSDLEMQIDQAVREFGFHRETLPSQSAIQIWTSGTSGRTVELAALDGSSARINIALRLDRSTITIRDFDNSVETPFMQALKKQIEQQIATRYGIQELRFERQADVFGP